jgi:hypothetical protein
MLGHTTSCTAAHYVELCLDHPSGEKQDIDLQEIRKENANHVDRTVFVGDKPALVVLNFANSHVMDYGRQAMEGESIPLFERLKSDTFQTIGLGMTLEQASKPATVDCKSTSVQVFAFSTSCSGTSKERWATKNRSGVLGLPGLHSKEDVNSAVDLAKLAFKREPKPDSLLRILSIHWVGMINGHSSHHSRGMFTSRILTI